VGISFNCGMSEALTEAGGKTRLYVTGDLGEGVAVALDEGQAHYLLHVLRAKAGTLSRCSMVATANGGLGSRKRTSAA